MKKLNDILHELGISKVKLAKFLGVSRQMIYNYLEFDSINKWPKDKKVLLLNLLGIKSAEDMDDLKVDTDYIMTVESRMNSFLKTSEENNKGKNSIESLNMNTHNLGRKQKELLENIVLFIKEKLEDDDSNDDSAYKTFQYIYYFLQAMNTSKETKYILGYVAKTTGFVKPLEFAFDEEEQFLFESIMFSAMTLYTNGGASKPKIAESHRRFVNQIEHKMEEKMSRTMELNSAKVQALKELNYTEINELNAAEVLSKIVEIQSRKVVD
ncbi:MAG: hypothetical protein PHN72_04425 [Bacilli bacterium]|nr:hypothetical protein [Bacilli bacterium]